MSDPAVHPGKILAEELEGLGVTPTELARQLDVPANRISQIICPSSGFLGQLSL